MAGDPGSKLIIGEQGTGTLNVGVIGAPGTGTVNALGGTVIGLAGGTGTVNLNPGGTLSTVYISPAIAAGGASAGGGFSFVNFNGGTLASRVGANSAPTMFMQGISQAGVQAGGAIIDTSATSVTIAQPLVHDAIFGTGATDGGLTKTGGNTLTLTGANAYYGPTNVNAGILSIAGAGASIGLAADPNTGAPVPSGAVTVALGATLTGTGTFNLGTNNLTINGTLAAGLTEAATITGTLSVVSSGMLTLANTATTTFDIGTGADRDLFVGTGLTLRANGTLALRGTIDPTMTYTLFTGLAAETGTYSSVTGTPANYNPVFTFTGGNYNLSFAAVPEPSTWAMGVFGLGLGGLLLRRRRVA